MSRISVPRRWLAGALLVTVGWLASPGGVPVYDGVGAPDEPYRYVQAPAGATTTAEPTVATATTPVKDGLGTNGLSVATAEVGPQFSLYLPPRAMATSSGPIEVTATPRAPTDQPRGARIDGNVYVVSLTAAGGVVTLTEKAALATVYLRATTATQPPPELYYRADATGSWQPLKTSRGGTDFYVASFSGPGQYAVVFSDSAGGGVPVLPLVVVGVLVLLVVAVVVVRLRSTTGDVEV